MWKLVPPPQKMVFFKKIFLFHANFYIVIVILRDVNEEILETVLIPDFWLYTFGCKQYCAYPTLKDNKSRNWEKQIKDRQYPGLQFT